jgi:hypothetical protein
MKKPINELERLKLIAGLINEVEYNEAAHGVVKKTSLTEAKETKEVTLDTVNPYEYRHGLSHELEQLDDYSNEGLAKAKAIVLKNLSKDINYYTTLLNQDQSPYEFKAPETDAPGMQANADGTLKKGAGKLEKANVKDNLGKKEEGDKKPKGVKEMPDKGVEGKEKTIKEGIESDPVNGDSSAEGQFNQLMSKYDWYHEMSDDPRKWDMGTSVDQKLKSLAKTIGIDKAVELFNAKAPSDRKVTSNWFMEGKEDKHSKLKEMLKKGLKELMQASDIQAAKMSGKPVNVSKSNSQDIKALQTAKVNYTTYE